MSIPFSTQQFEKKSNRHMPVSRVRVDRVIATQVRLDPAKVKAIASKPASSDDTPPIVTRHNGNFIMGDGHHRFAAAIERGDTHIPVRVVK